MLNISLINKQKEKKLCIKKPSGQQGQNKHSGKLMNTSHYLKALQAIVNNIEIISFNVLTFKITLEDL